MEIISYVSTTDGYTHYLFNNSMGIPFDLWLLLMGSLIGVIFLVFKKLIG